MSRAQAFCCHKMFSESRTLVEDEQCNGRPSATQTGVSTAYVRELVWSNRRLPVRMIADEVNMNWETVRLLLTEELGMRKIFAKMVPKNLTEQQQDARLSTLFDIQMHYGDAASSLRTWSRTLQLLFISKSKIGSERTPFWVNGRHPEVCNADLKGHPTNCIPGMLQTMAAPLVKVCAGTRDVLWRWPQCSWWINKIKLSLEPVSLLYCQVSCVYSIAYAWRHTHTHTHTFCISFLVLVN